MIRISWSCVSISRTLPATTTKTAVRSVSRNTLETAWPRQLRFQFGRDREPGTANSDVTEARIQTGGGFLQLGRNNFSPRETTIKRMQFIDNISYTRGAHSMKVGTDLNFDRI